jgi:hypothetical protein
LPTADDIEEKCHTDFGITIDRHEIDMERQVKKSDEKQASRRQNLATNDGWQMVPTGG